MRALERNKRKFYYCLYQDKRGIVDEYGNSTGESIVIYGEAVEIKANVSQATGQSSTEQFGNLDNYDKVIVTTDMNCPIDENSVLFLDKEPEYTEVTTHVPTAITTTDDAVRVPVYDYTVRRVARSLNSISIAVKKVDVS
jgi:hypothetical protein